MCLDETKQTFVFLQVVNELGQCPGTSDDEIKKKMQEISIKIFGDERYAFFPLNLASISRKEFDVKNIIRKEDSSIALTNFGKDMKQILYKYFIHEQSRNLLCSPHALSGY